jgi:hypothetical protein
MKLHQAEMARDNYRRFLRENDLTRRYLMWKAKDLGIDDDTIAELNAGFDDATQQTPRA